MAVSDMAGSKSQMKCAIEEERRGLEEREEQHCKQVDEYVHRVKEMVKDTGILKEVDPSDREEWEAKRKRRCKFSSFTILFSVHSVCEAAGSLCGADEVHEPDA